jgi:hypothetical protein
MRSQVTALIAVALAAACGGVPNSQPDATPPLDDAPDATTCTIHDTVQSCGPACLACPAPARGTPTCNGTACGLSCGSATGPRCGDGSCTQFVFDFESNTLEDIHVRAPAGHPIAVRTKDGSLALAIDVASLPPAIHIGVPVCLTDTVDAHARTLRARILFDGGELSTQQQYYINVSQPTASGPQFLEFIGAFPRVWTDYSGPLSKSQFSNTLDVINFELGTFGARFSGTIWMDDITIQ